MTRYRLIHLLLLLAMVTSACASQTQTMAASSDSAWFYRDLIALDPPDQSSSAIDLVAVYFRKNSIECQIRLDFLDSSSGDPPQVYIGLDYQTGGKRNLPFWDGQFDDKGFLWDLLIGVSATDQISMVLAKDSLETTQNVFLRASRNISQDYLVVSFDCQQIGIQQSITKLAVFIFDAKKYYLSNEIEHSEVLSLDTPPPAPANILFYFYNTFSGKTPAQALKKWDGAHTGTNSTRHGLRYILDAVENTRIPVVLADLKTPENLSALDYMGKIPQIGELERDQLLILPDYSFLNQPQIPLVNLPDEIYNRSFQWSQNTSEGFKLAKSPVFVAGSWPASIPFPPGHYLAIPKIINGPEIVSICIHGQVRVLCQADSPPPEWTNDETSLGELPPAILRELVNSAMRNTEEILLIGGDFDRSGMGDIGSAQNVFSYIQNHPWIKAVTAYDLVMIEPKKNLQALTIPSPEAPFVQDKNLQGVLDAFLRDLTSIQQNELSEFAWQALFSLLRSDDARLNLLNLNSIGQIGFLSASIRWLDHPYIQKGCEKDLNWDGQVDCILATEKSFAVFDSRSGGLIAGFFLQKTDVMQFASSSFFIANGVSDPSQWKPELGVYGDPDAPGAALLAPAYADKGFFTEIIDGKLLFTSIDAKIRYEYQLTENSFLANFKFTTPLPIQLQMVSNPWERFHPGWWRSNQDSIKIQSTFEFRSNDFATSLPYLSEPEDPNFDYGRGHYVLFPFRIINFEGSREGWIEITAR